MNKAEISLTTLLERLESEFETADGRTVRLCRDASGNYWVVDGAERVVPLSAFAADCGAAARQLRAREVGALRGRLVARMREVFARVTKGSQRVSAKTSHA